MTPDQEREQLVKHLLFYSRQMEAEGHLNAARYMDRAAHEIAFLRYELMLKDKHARETHQ